MFPSIRWARFEAVLGQVDEAVNQTACSTQPPSRRQVLSVGDDGVCLHRHPRVLVQPYGEGGETVQEGDRPTYSGMDRVEGRCSAAQLEAYGASQRSVVHLPIGSSEFRRGIELLRVPSIPIRRTVSFSDRITIDWPPGMNTVARRRSRTLFQRRFKIRIRQTEDAIGYIFSVEHRDKMFSLFDKMPMM